MSRENTSPTPIDIAGLLAGLLSFASSVPFSILRPSNVDWLLGEDPAVSYLGWEFFRHDEWRIPFGLNPTFGLELSSSIVFTDSLPLIAFPAKLLTSGTDTPFQYFGIWILFCMLMQGIFASKIAYCLGHKLPACLLLSVLICSLPFHLTRLSYGYGHLALFAHFLILAALYFAIRPAAFSRAAWVLLLSTALLTMAYLFLIVLFIFIAACGQNMRVHSIKSSFAIYIGLTGAWLTTLAYMIGYFATSAESLFVGFGSYNAHPRSLFSSQARGEIFWSHLLTQNGAGGALYGDGEGFGFIGLGGVALTLLSCAMLARSWFEGSLHRHLGSRSDEGGAIGKPLLLISALLAYLSLAKSVSIGAYEIPIPTPLVLNDLLNRFRSNGRLLWPLAYLLVFLSAQVIRRSQRRLVVLVLAAATCLQLVDTAEARDLMKEKLAFGYNFESSMEQEISEAVQLSSPKVQSLRIFPPDARPEDHWIELALAALENSIATGAFTISRVDPNRSTSDLTLWEYLRAHEGDSLVVTMPDWSPDLSHPHVRKSWGIIEANEFLILYPTRGG